MSSTTFINALLVDRPGSTYTVHISAGIVQSILPSNSPSPARTPAESEIIDLDGRFYLGPSLVDAHVHFTSWTLNSSRPDLSSATSAREAIRLMEEAATKDRGGGETTAPLVGRDYRVGKWPDIKEMTKENLDHIAPHRPVILISGDLHTLWFSTKGFQHLGIDPLGQVGVLYEKPAFEAMNALNRVGEEELFPLIDEAGKAAAALGVTQIIELEQSHNIPNWLHRVSKGFNSLRVECGMYTEHIEDAISRGLKSGDQVPGGEGLVTVGAFKVVTDGSLGARTAYCCDPYPSTTSYGLRVHSPSTLASLLTHATSHSLKLAIHAIGDAANSLTLTTLAAMNPPPLPSHLLDDKELAERFWKGRTERAFPYRSLVDAGAQIRLGSDAPVAPLNPWFSIAAGISRSQPDEESLGGGGGGGWHPEQCLTNREAYEASTANGRAGIREGEVADLCVVDRDPLSATPGELRGIGVGGTMLGGRWTHRVGI
ncbi:putative hydrolase [Leucosporidium creatinivorum]|uniref:Putative hydrolase n=1 Tax=Leucosporidium creatinivorum TaxID=106004 RepID=A0A1Y2G084_9BASI|nr:putative hydrolase [Leucosporidium creatinivorum]